MGAYFYKLLVFCIGMVGLGPILTKKDQPELGLDFKGPSVSAKNTFNVGYEFEANSNLTVTGLASYYDPAFYSRQNRQVGLWTSGGTLIASAFITPYDPIIGKNNDWLMTAITPVTLTAGDTYVVGGQGGPEFSSTSTNNYLVSPSITNVVALYHPVSGNSNNPLQFPTIFAVGINSGNIIIGPHGLAA